VKVVTKLKMTCWACPSQWSGETDDGRGLYIRYRWGNLTAEEGVGGAPIFQAQVGDGYAGVMSTGEMMRHLSGVLDFSQLQEIGDYA
jgi:hypothetical protein